MKRLVVASALVVGAFGSASAQSTITMLDPGTDVGLYPSVAIGTDGLALVAYHDLANLDLKVAHCSNPACTAATITTLDSAGGVGARATIEIGADGRGIIAYTGTPASGVVKTAHCNDVACTSASVQTIESTSPIGGAVGLMIGSDGLPLIGYVANNPFPTPSRLHVAHCSVPDCSSFTVGNLADDAGDVLLEKGADGLGLFVTSRGTRRCLDVACTAVTSPPEPDPLPIIRVELRGMVVPADGRALIASSYSETQFPIAGRTDASRVPNDILEARLARCNDASCTGLPLILRPPGLIPDVALQTNGLPWFAYRTFAGIISLRACNDANCLTTADVCVYANASDLSLARGADGQPLIAFRSGGLAVSHGADPCVAVAVGVSDTSVVERPGAQASFPIALSVAAPVPVTVNYATLPGTALAGQDYVATSGTVTFPPGTTTVTVPVSIVADAEAEPPETFSLLLTGASGNTTIADNLGVATITDVTPDVVAGTCAPIEGDAGPAECDLTVALSEPSPNTVTVDYATAAGTAASGIDFLPASGTLTFAPGSVSQAVTIAVVGDVSVELDETFFVNLTNAVNATIVDGTGEGLIVDDDAPSLSSLELTHGAVVRDDLAAGPAADEDVYRLAQGPYSSWEVIVDEVSGDVAPGFELDRLAEDNIAVLQTGVPVSAFGTAKALRWERRSALPETRQHIRVRNASCATDCGDDDTYRLRVRETTGVIPRFNNAGSQITVLILQNATDQPIQANADFWAADGSLAATVPVPLAPHAVGIVNTSAIAALAGISGSVTVTHNGPYGAVAGKAVALEPSTGFSFDSPMVSKPR